MAKTSRSEFATTIVCECLALAAGCGTSENEATRDPASIEQGQIASAIGYHVRVGDTTVSGAGYLWAFPTVPIGDQLLNIGWEALDANGALIPGSTASVMSVADFGRILVQPRGCDITSVAGCEGFPRPRVRLHVISASGLTNVSRPTATSPALNTDAATFTVGCPAGTVALSGGWEVRDVGTGRPSEPLQVFFRGGAVTPNAFGVTGRRPVTGSSWRIIASAVCAAAPPGFQRRAFSGVRGQGMVFCGGNQHVLGAGSTSFGFDAWHPITNPEGTSGWSYLSSTPSVPTSVEMTCIN